MRARSLQYFMTVFTFVFTVRGDDAQAFLPDPHESTINLRRILGLGQYSLIANPVELAGELAYASIIGLPFQH